MTGGRVRWLPVIVILVAGIMISVVWLAIKHPRSPGKPVRHRLGPRQVQPVISCGPWNVVFVASDGTLWGWADPVAAAATGAKTGSGQRYPVQIGKDDRWKTVATGASHTVGVKADGSLWVMGANNSGQLGLGNLVRQQKVPAQLGTQTDWAAVSAGMNSTLALKDDGTLWAWGGNNFGQLGNGTTTPSPVPIQVGAGTNWIQISAGMLHCLALRRDGSLWTWGDNPAIPLASGSLQNLLVPTRVGTDTNWVAVAAGSYHSLALKEDGTAWGWGRNAQSVFGSSAPGVPVPYETNHVWAAIKGGSFNNLLLDRAGTIWTTPAGGKRLIEIGKKDWVCFAAGPECGVAMAADGKLWTWGKVLGVPARGNIVQEILGLLTRPFGVRFRPSTVQIQSNPWVIWEGEKEDR